MSRLIVTSEETSAAVLLDTDDCAIIARELAPLGVRFERWQASAQLPPDADQVAVIDAYRDSIDRLQRECGYRSVDVIRMAKGTPDVAPIRAKFLAEHTHDDDEVRFFVEGRGAFYLRASGRVYQVICERDDLISVPAGTRHWFDMGPDPAFTALRLFTNEQGWIANFTGDAIAERFFALEPAG